MESQRNSIAPQLASKILNKFFDHLDNNIYCLEEENTYLKEEIKELKNKIWELEKERLDNSQKFIASTLLACLGADATEINDPTMAVILSSIYKLNTIEEVREYIEKIKENSLNKLNEK